MKKINFLSALMAAAAVLASCNTAEIDNGQPSVSAGDVISFNLSKTVETKTEYSEEDDWQINWLSGGQDKVLIVCDEAQPEVTAAEYSVTRDENQKNAGNLEATGDELCWGR